MTSPTSDEFTEAWSLAQIWSIHASALGGVIIVNPGRGKTKERLINQRLIDFLVEGPYFLRFYVIPDNRSAAAKKKLKAACIEILRDFTVTYGRSRVFCRQRKDLYSLIADSNHGLNHVVCSGLHQYIVRITRDFVNRIAGQRVSSVFSLGSGQWTCSATFQFEPLNSNDITAIQKITMKRTANARTSFQPNTTVMNAARNVETIPRQNNTPMPASTPQPTTEIRTRLWDLYRLECVLEQLSVQHALVSPRESWEQVFTTKCNQSPTCLRCRRCRVRFAQATCVLVAAQGCRDVSVLPRLGAVFRHPRYEHFSIEEWGGISLQELVTVYHHLSKQALNAHLVLLFLGCYKDADIPTTLAEITSHYGFGKKTACLLLSAVGVEQVGIPVDRHLLSGFVQLGWVPSNVRDETKASNLVEAWLPKNKWETCNVVLASIRQIWQQKLYQPMLLSSANSLGPEFTDVVNRLCCDC
jgi:hypothetical protein